MQSLAQEFDVVDVAAAAVRLIHEAGERTGERTESPRATSPEPAARAKEVPAPSGPFARIYVSIGQAAGAQKGDLVGAITGEAKVDASAIGGVEIEERYSLVDVREDRADDVLRALRGATIRGRPVTVSRYETDKAKKKRARSTRALFLVLAVAAAAPASSPGHGAIQVYAALAGTFAFVQPDGTLTVLDSSDGKVLFRAPARVDERYSWNSFFDTPHGLVVRSYRWKLLTRDENVYRRLDFKTQATAWEVASARECHVGEDYLICPDWRGRLVARQLADGRELWTYRPESATGEVLDRKGRILVSAHDEDRSWREREDGTTLLTSRDHVRSLAVLDGRTGQELLTGAGSGRGRGACLLRP